ncbi:AAA family ATPase [Pseudonocardia sp. C8]|nr:AAA family ATPase [Pseudonocardia sp. C8]
MLAAAADGRQILVVEGERDVETAREYGVTATCSVGGSSGGWKAEHTAALVGADVLVVRDRDDPGRAHAERVRAALSGRARSVRVVEPVPGHKGADLTDHVHAGYGVEDLADVETVATGRQSRITWASQIEPEPVVWAWTTEDGHGRVPAGSQVIAAGREGTGKSSFAIWMAAQISRGTLPGAFHGTPRRVLYVTVEDSWKHTIVPRLIAAGADLSMIGRFDVITESGADGALSLPHDNDLLESEIIRHEVAATMVDPLMSAVAQKIDTHREREVRTALDPLTALADRTGAVILGIAHFNKSSGTDVSNLITASGAFKNVARAVLGFARDDDGRVMTQTKNSLGRDDLPSLSYTLTPVDIPTPKGTAATARFDFTGPSSRSVEDLLRDAKETSGDPDERAERDHAVDWLNKYLNDKGGTAPFQDIREAAQKVDIPERTLQRVRHRAGVRSRRRGFQQGAIWSIDSDHPRRARESPQGGMTGGIGSDQGERTGADDEPGADDWSVSAGHAQSGHSRRSMDSPQDPGADRPCCSRCRHPSDHPLINGRCRSCAYPPGTDSPYREEN